MYNVETGELIDHDPKYLSTMRIPVKFDPNGFLLQILTSGQRYAEKPIDIQALNDD